MANKQRFSLLAMLIMSVSALGMGAVTFRLEYPPASLGNASSGLPEFVSIMETGAALPVSVWGQRVFLQHCQSILQRHEPLALRFVAEASKFAAPALCLDLAQRTVMAASSDSYAWLILALAQARTGKMEEASRSIKWSGRTGPNMTWVAEMRFNLVQDNYLQLASEAQAVGDLDIALLVQANRNRLVAQRYIADVSFRDRATNIIETLPEAAQSRFLSAVRRQLAETAR